MRRHSSVAIRLLSLLVLFTFMFMTFVMPLETSALSAEGQKIYQNSNEKMLLGPAGSFDLFAFGDVKGLTHVEGTVAIKGNYESTNGLSMATSLQNNPSVNDKITLLIGGKLNANNPVMSCCAGIIGYTTEPNMPSYLFYKATQLEQMEVINFFNEEYNYLSNLSKSLLTEEEIVVSYSDITVSGDGKKVITLRLDGINYINSFKITNVQEQIVINIIGAGKLTIRNFQPDAQAEKILLNIVGIEEIDLSYSQTEANILAINTNIVGTNGYIGGTTICNNLYSEGSFEIHHNNFIGKEEQPVISETDKIPDDSEISKSDTIISETDIPVISESDTPIISNSDVPTVSESDVPVISNSDAPVISETDIPIISDSNIPIISETDIPTVTESDIPTISDSNLPPVSDTDVPETPNQSDSDVESNTDIVVSDTDLPTVPEIKEEIEKPEGKEPPATEPIKKPTIQKGEVLGDSEGKKENLPSNSSSSVLGEDLSIPNTGENSALTATMLILFSCSAVYLITVGGKRESSKKPR